MLKRPAFWILLALVSVLRHGRRCPLLPSGLLHRRARHHDDARARARRCARDCRRATSLGPAGYRQAASFALDSEAQTFVELEGGGKEAFTRMLRDGLYSAYTWRVRHFREGETNETTLPLHARRPAVRLRREAEGGCARRGARRAAARAIGAEARRAARWNVDLAPFTLVEQGQERRPGGRVDHTLTYERSSASLGRRTLPPAPGRLRRSPDGSHALRQDPRSVHPALRQHAFGERGHRHRFGRRHGAPLRRRRHRRRPVLHAAQRATCCGGRRRSGARRRRAADARRGQRVAADLDELRHGRAAQHFSRQSDRGVLLATLLGFSAFLALSFMAAETLTRRAFGQHPQFWRVWTKGAGKLDSRRSAGRSAGYLLVSVFFAYDVALYVIATRCLRMVDAVRGPAPPRRPRHIRAVAVGDRQFAAGGILGGMPVSRRADRRRRAHRRPLRQARTRSSLSPSSSRPSSLAQGTRRIQRSPPSPGPSS